jgi:hypothetical protein
VAFSDGQRPVGASGGRAGAQASDVPCKRATSLPHIARNRANRPNNWGALELLMRRLVAVATLKGCSSTPQDLDRHPQHLVVYLISVALRQASFQLPNLAILAALKKADKKILVPEGLRIW